jgi:hypothetical protein
MLEHFFKTGHECLHTYSFQLIHNFITWIQIVWTYIEYDSVKSIAIVKKQLKSNLAVTTPSYTVDSGSLFPGGKAAGV